MKNGLAYKNQNVYLKIDIYSNQAYTLSFRPVLLLYRNQSTDLWSKSMVWFLYNGNTGFKKANPNHRLFHILLFLFMKKPSFSKCPRNPLFTILCSFEYYSNY